MNILSWVVMALSTFPRDLKMSYDYVETMSQLNYWRWSNYKVYQIFDEVVKDYPQKVALRLGHETWTFHMLQEYSLQVANYFHTAGLQQGDVVAQVGIAGPQSVGLWLGLSRLGVITAILPSHLSPTSTVQMASSVFSKAFICDSKLVGDIKQQTLPDYMSVFSTEPTEDKSVKDLKKELAEVPTSHLKENKKITTNERLLYLFSPDTLTPIPVTNYRYAFIATALHKTLDLSDKDILYLPLLKHESESSIVGSGQAVINGNSVVFRKDFVASSYFPDCDNYGATVALYTESIVKDLLALPPSAADTKHNVRLVMGKGLRNPQTWTQFKDRFKIHRIGEYFGSADSENYNMVNSYNKAGAVGYLPWFSSPLYHIDLVSYNPNTGDINRNTEGLCIPPEHGKPGILIDELPKEYTKNQFTMNKNIITDVFKKGDAYVNTGDILMKDEHGYFYVVDTVADIKRRNDLSQNLGSSQETQDSSHESQTQSVTAMDVENTQTPQETTKVTHDKEHVDENDSSPEHVLGHQHIDDDEDHVDHEQPATAQNVARDVPQPSEQPEKQPQPEPEVEPQLQPEPKVETQTQPTPKLEPKSQPQPVYHDIEERFQEAANAVMQKGEKFPQNTKLVFYGLYKQATLGDVNIDKPWLGMEERAKWDAWKANENMSKFEAMKRYRHKAESLGLIAS